MWLSSRVIHPCSICYTSLSPTHPLMRFHIEVMSYFWNETSYFLVRSNCNQLLFQHYNYHSNCYQLQLYTHNCNKLLLKGNRSHPIPWSIRFYTVPNIWSLQFALALQNNNSSYFCSTLTHHPYTPYPKRTDCKQWTLQETVLHMACKQFKSGIIFKCPIICLQSDGPQNVMKNKTYLGTWRKTIAILTS